MLAPNLDAMTESELKAFDGFDTVALFEGLFPEKPTGALTATIVLQCYARDKLRAIEKRKIGEIESAIVFEARCDRLYFQLPTYARW